MELTRYLSVKLVNATPMTRGAYCEFRGWDVPDNENPDDEGYLVEYLNSPNPNVDSFKNYVSWSPKAVFDMQNNQLFHRSEGALRVRLAYNPNTLTNVDRIKIRAADLINEIQSLVNSGERSEAARSVATAMTHIQIGCMMAVHGATHETYMSNLEDKQE